MLRDVHVCPAGTYVRGLDGKEGLLTCCFDRERGHTELVPSESAHNILLDMEVCSDAPRITI